VRQYLVVSAGLGMTSVIVVWDRGVMSCGLAAVLARSSEVAGYQVSVEERKVWRFKGRQDTPSC
jgi:hypothetical protein